MRWGLGCALVGVSLAIVGCADPGSGRALDSGGGPGGGGKADDVDEVDEDLSHAEQVEVCDLAAEAAGRNDPDAAERLQIQNERRDCIAEVNDSAVPVIEDALEDADHPGVGFTRSVLRDNRETAASMCEQLAAAGDTPRGPEADVSAATCEAVMERNLADLIGRHVDLGDEPVAIPGAYRRYFDCYNTVDQPTDDDENSADDNDQALEDQIDAYDRLAHCIHAADATLTVEMGERIADAKGGDAVRQGQTVFNLLQGHRARLDVVCDHFAHAGPRSGPDPVRVGQHRCLIAGLEARGRMIDAITGLVPEVEGERPDPSPEPDPDKPGQPDPTPGEACYPGPDNDWTTCLPVVTFTDVPEGYDYASGFGGNPNYRPPVAFLDLEQIGGDTQLAPSFKLSEIAQLWKGRYAVVQPHAVASLQQLRDRVGPVSLNSGYRSPEYNAGVGGAQFSRHMYGDGFDFSPTQTGLSAGESACTDLGGKLVEYSSHVHCDFRFDAVDTTFFGPAHAAAVYEGPRFDAVLTMRDGEYETSAEGFEEGEPVRRWAALDAEGFVIGRHRGRTFAPPPRTATVRVVVGGVVEVEAPVTAR